MSVKCNFCENIIVVWPKKPFEIVEQDGKPVIPTDYSPVYEHIRDEHPGQWSDNLAAEYEGHRGQKGA